MTKILWIVMLLVAALGAGVTPAQATGKVERTVAKYRIPDVVLVNQEGQKVKVKNLIEADRPVLVEFIYGTCTTICPILSANFASLQRRLGDDSGKLRLVSISIDPEHDTPAVMKEYLNKYRARPGWDFLTGSRSDIYQVMRALNAFIPDKMSHFPLTLIRNPVDGSWVRLNGLMSSAELLTEYGSVARR